MRTRSDTYTERKIKDVNMVKEGLALCEKSRGKEDRSLVAGDIMYYLYILFLQVVL